MGGKRELVGWALAAVSGFMFPLGSPPYGMLWAPWLGVMLALTAHRLVTSTSRRVRFGLGLTIGMGVGLGAAGWIVGLLVRFAGVPYFVGVLGWLAFCFWLAIPYGIWLLLLSAPPTAQQATSSNLTWQRVLWPSVVFCAVHAAWPLIFPYTIIIGLALKPAWIQLAEFGGVALLELLVVLCASLVVEALFGGRPARRYWLPALAIPLFLVGFGSWRMAALDRAAEGAPLLRIGVVQPNIPIGPMPIAERMHRLWSPSRELEQLGVDLIIWPEAGIYPFRVPRPFQRDVPNEAFPIRQGFSQPLMLGAVSGNPADGFDHNSAYLLDSNGRVSGSYDKVRLVVFGEYMPFVNPEWLAAHVGGIAHISAGTGPARFELAATPDHPAVAIGPLICLEDIIPGYVREVARQPKGVAMFVNLTIDSWYGHRVEPWQHLALARFRAVEHRVPLLRSVSTGVSAIVDFNGRLIAQLPSLDVNMANRSDHPPQHIRASVQLPRNTEKAPTVYASVGWLLPHICQLGVLLKLALTWQQARTRT
ncbi:MAG: apolipoprotein N-acyltransferase [Myxococcales bacterium]|nr:apolipoprotein N-acyltransferase [Myxococcales bacterium]